MRRRYLYLLPDGLHPTVVDSQVVTVLRRLADEGLRFDVFAYQFNPMAGDRERVKNRLESIRRELPGKVMLWRWPYPRFLVRTPEVSGQAATSRAATDHEARERWLAPLRRLALRLRDLAVELLVLMSLLPSMVGRERIVIHARGSAALVALRLRRWYSGCRVVSDIRGDAPAEFLHGSSLRGFDPESALVRAEHARLLALEGRIVRESDSVQVVSEALRRRLAAAHGLPPERIRVVPCVADERHFRYDAEARGAQRQALGLAGERLLVYSGSLQAWQGVDGLLATWRQLRPLLPQARLLLLTPDLGGARQLLAANGLREGADAWIRSAAFSEVARYLCAADIGLLLRDPHPLNAAASPTKLAEYLLCGLPVVASGGIGDLDATLEAEALGVLVDRFRDPGRLEDALRRADVVWAAESRASRAARAAALFALGSRIPAWANLYRGL